MKFTYKDPTKAILLADGWHTASISCFGDGGTMSFEFTVTDDGFRGYACHKELHLDMSGTDDAMAAASELNTIIWAANLPIESGKSVELQEIRNWLIGAVLRIRVEGGSVVEYDREMLTRQLSTVSEPETFFPIESHQPSERKMFTVSSSMMGIFAVCVYKGICYIYTRDLARHFGYKSKGWSVRHDSTARHYLKVQHTTAKEVGLLRTLRVSAVNGPLFAEIDFAETYLNRKNPGGLFDWLRKEISKIVPVTVEKQEA